MDDMLRRFRALGDLTRLRILRMLAVKPLCVCEVMSVLDMAQSTASKHLRIMADAGLIEAVPGGTWTVYHLAKPGAGSAEAFLLDLVKGMEPTEQLRKDADLARKADRQRICRSQLERSLKQKRQK